MERLLALEKHLYWRHKRFLLVYCGWLLARLDYNRLRMASLYNSNLGLNITLFTFGIIMFILGIFYSTRRDCPHKIIAVICTFIHPIAFIYFICDFLDGFVINENYDWFKLVFFIFHMIIIVVAVACSVQDILMVKMSDDYYEEIHRKRRIEVEENDRKKSFEKKEKLYRNIRAAALSDAANIAIESLESTLANNHLKIIQETSQDYSHYIPAMDQIYDKNNIQNHYPIANNNETKLKNSISYASSAPMMPNPTMYHQSFSIQPSVEAPSQYSMICTSSGKILPNLDKNQMPFYNQPPIVENIIEIKAKHANSCSAGLIMYNQPNEYKIYPQHETGLTQCQIKNGLLDTIRDHPDPPTNATLPNLDRNNVKNIISNTSVAIQPTYSKSQTNLPLQIIPSSTTRMKNSSSLDLKKNELSFLIVDNNNTATKESTNISHVNTQPIQISDSHSVQSVLFPGQQIRSNSLSLNNTNDLPTIPTKINHSYSCDFSLISTEPEKYITTIQTNPIIQPMRPANCSASVQQINSFSNIKFTRNNSLKNSNKMGFENSVAKMAHSYSSNHSVNKEEQPVKGNSLIKASSIKQIPSFNQEKV